jgi:hypothetical protein
MIDRSLQVTDRERAVLVALSWVDRSTRRSLGLRDSRILLNLEERGLVARNLHDQWYIRDKGKKALSALITTERA